MFTLKNRKGGKAERKGPSQSATKFRVGIRKMGNDRNKWDNCRK